MGSRPSTADSPFVFPGSGKSAGRPTDIRRMQSVGSGAGWRPQPRRPLSPDSLRRPVSQVLDFFPGIGGIIPGFTGAGLPTALRLGCCPLGFRGPGHRHQLLGVCGSFAALGLCKRLRAAVSLQIRP